MLLIDANVFMYAAGTAHRFKSPAVEFLRTVALGETEGGIDAEVLQEILHRYRAIGRWEQGRLVYDSARKLVSIVFPVTVEILDRTRALMDKYPKVIARDALHAAAVLETGAIGLASFDQDFDAITEIYRIEP